MKWYSIERFAPAVRVALLLLVVSLLVACGDKGSENDQPTADVVVQVAMATESDSASGSTKDLTDCEDVETVEAAVYDSDGEVIQTGGPWACTEGGGTITNVPANRRVNVVVVGLDVGGVALYRGQTTASFYLPAGETVDAGTISAGPFEVTLTFPISYDYFNPSIQSFEWQAEPGAVSYWVYVWENIDSTRGPLLTGYPVQVDASANPSYQPDAAAFSLDYAYKWGVQAVDAAGNQSGTVSDGNYTDDFTVYSGQIDPGSQEELTITIHSPSPFSAQAFMIDQNILFDANVTDPSGNLIQSQDLDNILWMDGPESNLLDNADATDPLSFYYAYSQAGSYEVTLQVQEVVNGTRLSGEASVAFTVYNPISITYPDDNGVYDIGLLYGSSENLAVEYVGDLSGVVALAWNLRDPEGTNYPAESNDADPPIMRQAEFFYDYLFMTGGYTISVDAMYSDERSVTFERTFTLINNNLSTN